MGLGYQLSESGEVRFAGHGGSNQGWMASLQLSPDTQDALVVMTNGSNGQFVLRAVTCAWQVRVSGEGWALSCGHRNI